MVVELHMFDHHFHDYHDVWSHEVSFDPAFQSAPYGEFYFILQYFHAGNFRVEMSAENFKK